MTQDRKPDFERYMTTLHCEEPDRVPLGDCHVDQMLKDAFMGKKIQTPEDQVDFFRGEQQGGPPTCGAGAGFHSHHCHSPEKNPEKERSQFDPLFFPADS